MARGFTVSPHRCLYVRDTPVTDYPFTLACWFNSHLDETGYWDDYLLTLTDKDDSYDRDVLAVQQNGGTPYLTASTSTNWDALDRSPRNNMLVTRDVWSHGAAVFASGSSRRAYLNGVQGNEATVSLSPNARDAFGIACTTRASSVGAGIYADIAEAAVWDVALTHAEIQRLALGFSPLLVRPDALCIYVPLVRDEDRDIVGGLELTPTNSPTVVEHPRVIYVPRLWTGYASGGLRWTTMMSYQTSSERL